MQANFLDDHLNAFEDIMSLPHLHLSSSPWFPIMKTIRRLSLRLITSLVLQQPLLYVIYPSILMVFIGLA
jgi:hypothetical protein